VLAVVAVAALGLRALRGSTASLVGLGAVVAVALLAHRQAIGLLPAWLLVCAFGLARRAPQRRPVGPALLALALPAVTMALLAGKLWRTLSSYDVPRNFLPAGGGGLGPLFSPTRLLDLLSALVMLAPLAFVIPVLWPGKAALVRDGSDADASADARNSWTLLLVLAAPFLIAALLARPPQGLIRDWDGLAAAGVALSLLAAWEIARVLRAPARAWLAVPVTAVAASFTLSWLLHYHDQAQAIRRVEALLLEPPSRPSAERSRAWEFLAWHESRREQWDAAAQAFDSASALGPTPRMLAQWAMAETMRKNYPQARALYRRAVASDSNFTMGWTGVAVAAIWFEDWDDCERAARQLQRLAPRDPKTIEIEAYLAQVRRAPPPRSR
jgi:tetratricopeptide (TPR) repeat protein